jgi:hypothetical protein
MDYFENESGLDPAEIAQASPQGIDAVRPSRRRSETEVSDASDLCRLLRARRERPRRSAVNKRDEIPSRHGPPSSWGAIAYHSAKSGRPRLCVTAIRSLNVRFGSKADIGSPPVDVRFTPKSGHCETSSSRPLCATNGLTHRHKRSILFWLSDGSYAVKISRRKIVRQQITSERGRFGDSLGNDVGQ